MKITHTLRAWSAASMVFGGGAFEARTAGALALRLGFWMVVAWVVQRAWRA